MTRYHYATLLTAAGIIAAAFLRAPARWWCAGALFLAYLAGSGLGVFSIRWNYYCDSVCRGKPGGKRLALTFDDGPDPTATPALLDLLRASGARATFFCVGERAKANADLVRRIVKEGHTLGNHSYTHKWWTNFLTGPPMEAEILRAQRALKDLTGAAPVYYRSPMGLTNPHLGPVLRSLGLKLIGWDIRPYDRGRPAKETAARVVSAAGDGSIVLLHDGGAAPEELKAAVSEILERFQTLGYTFVSLDELFKDE